MAAKRGTKSRVSKAMLNIKARQKLAGKEITDEEARKRARTMVNKRKVANQTAASKKSSASTSSSSSSSRPASSSSSSSTSSSSTSSKPKSKGPGPMKGAPKDKSKRGKGYNKTNRAKKDQSGKTMKYGEVRKKTKARVEKRNPGLSGKALKTRVTKQTNAGVSRRRKRGATVTRNQKPKK